MSGTAPAPTTEPVLLLTGSPGVGKTTVARLLAEDAERAVHLESDWFFRFIRSGFVEPWRKESQEQNTTVMRIVAGAAAGYTDAGYATIVDGIISPRWFFEPLRDALRAAGHEVACAVLRAPVEVCLARVAGREGDAELADRSAIEQLWGDFADLGPLERHAIEVEGMSAEQVAAELAGRLRRGELACS
jgi:predicted kinase